VRRLALILVSLLFISSIPSYANPKKPTLAQIEAAKKIEAEAKKEADAAAARLVPLIKRRWHKLKPRMMQLEDLPPTLTSWVVASQILIHYYIQMAHKI